MIALVGNNDGPLVLLKSLSQEGIDRVCVGLQKPVGDELKHEYLAHVAADRFFEDFGESELLERLASYEIDLLINCFCNFKFVRLLDHYDPLNVHLAPLPRYRGRHPLPWALINGESEFGVTIHRMTAEIDAGDILWQRTVDVAPGTSVAELRTQLMEALADGFGTFAGQYYDEALAPAPNRDEEATYVARRSPADSELTEWHSRDTVYRKVMALRSEAHPAFLRVGPQPVPVKQATLARRYYVGLAAPFVSRLLPDGVEVVCQDGKSVVLQYFNPKELGIKINQKLPLT